MARKANNYKTTPRFIFQSIRNMGFTPKSCIFELIDNSIDAGADRIDITWNENILKNHELVVEDDGVGIEDGQMMNYLGTLGMDEKYSADRVGYYGVGFNASLINLMEEGTARVKSTHKGNTSVLKITHSDRLVYFDKNNKGNVGEPDGTKIVIPNIDKRVTEGILIRDISVTYYPNSIKNKNFKITVNGKNIEFIDPMYRSSKAVGLNRLQKSFKFGDDVLKLKTISFDPEYKMDNLSSWDREKGKPKFKPSCSGLYLRLGSRYINTGENVFPHFRWMGIMSKYRYELELPTRLLEDFGVQVNKSARIDFVADDPLMQDFYNKINEMTNEFVNRYNDLRGKTQAKELLENIEKLNKKLNEIISDPGRIKPLVNTPGVLEESLIETREFNGRDPEGDGVEPTDSGITRRGKDKKKRKSKSPKLPVKLSIESNGKSSPLADWFENDDVLHIVLNSDCEWINMFCKDPLDTQLVPILKVYSWIDSISRLGRDKHDIINWKREMLEVLHEETELLNKVLED